MIKARVRTNRTVHGRRWSRGWRSSPNSDLLHPRTDGSSEPSTTAYIEFDFDEDEWEELQAWEEEVCTGWYPRWGKPLGTLALLFLCLPFATLLSIPIALINWGTFRDPRRILYRQERVGWQGRIFHIYKFRTMREAPGTDFQSWQRGDGGRVTSFGRFLRRTHLDELPQLLNIIRGEMTFIGPRPEMVDVERWAIENVDGFYRRLVVRPGITGHAQVTQGHTPMDAAAYGDKLAANDFYLGQLSLHFDLAILARTVLCMLPLIPSPQLLGPDQRRPRERRIQPARKQAHLPNGSSTVPAPVPSPSSGAAQDVKA